MDREQSLSTFFLADMYHGELYERQHSSGKGMLNIYNCIFCRQQLLSKLCTFAQINWIVYVIDWKIDRHYDR